MIRISKLLLAIAIFLLMMLIVVGCAGSAPAHPTTEPVTPAPTQPPPLPQAPAEVKFISMAVTPIVAEPGQPVTVEVKVANPGGTAGSTRLALTVNGVQAEAKDFTVPPGPQTLTFTISENVSGIYEIKVAGFTDTIRVKQTGAYPRLVNVYVVWSGKIESADYLWHPQQEPTPQLKSLALYDMIAIPYTVAYYAPESIRQLRKLNPRIKIVALFWVGESDVADVKKEQSLHESWFLHYGNTPGSSIPPEQRRIKFGTGPWALWVMNPASEWSTYAPNYIHDKIISSGLFDGVYCDMVWEWEKVSVSAGNLNVNNIDINNDGVADPPAMVSQQFNNGMTQILKSTRELLGQQAIIICGCGAAWAEDSPYWTYANGLFQENALGTRSWSNHDFSTIWNTYQTNMQKPVPPSIINWIGADTDSVRFNDLKPTLPPADLQKMRYGLAITSLPHTRTTALVHMIPCTLPLSVWSVYGHGRSR